MNITIKSVEGKHDHYQVMGERNALLASYIFHPEDTSFALRMENTDKSVYLQQRHVEGKEGAEERVTRLFNGDSLHKEVSLLEQLTQHLNALREERSDTTSSDRFTQLTGTEIYQADSDATAQRDIVAAKLYFACKATAKDLHRLGIF